MREQLSENTEVPKQKTHELRIAVFSLPSRAVEAQLHLVSPSFSSPSLFRDERLLNSNGLVGVSNEDRATLLFKDQFKHSGMSYLKTLASLGVAQTIEEGDEPARSISGMAVRAAEPYDFRRFQFRAYDLSDVEKLLEAEQDKPNSTSLDPIDAQFIGRAMRVVRTIEYGARRQSA